MAMNFPSPASPGQIYAPPGGPVYRFDDPVWNAASDLDETWMVTPQMFGGAGDGIADDTAAIHTALATGKAVFLPEGIYKVSQLVIPANTIVRASQLAVLRGDGSTTGAQLVLDIGNNVDFDRLVVSTPGTGTPTYTMRVGDNVRGGLLRLVNDVPQANTGILSRGQDVRIDRIEVVNSDNAVAIDNQVATITTGMDIGFIDITSYRRGIYLVNTSGRIGGARVRVRTPNLVGVALGPGQNSILLGGCVGLEIGDCWLEESNEHAFRIGGSAFGGPSTRSVRIGNITAIKNRGCTFKINPGQIIPAENIMVGNITSIDSGGGAAEIGGNRETLRLSHCRDVTIGDVMSIADQETVSGQIGLIINNARNVHIASLGGAFNSGCITADSMNDAADGTDGGDVTGLRIDRLWGVARAPGGNAIYIGMGAYNVGDWHIHVDGVSDYTNLIRYGAGVLTDPIYLTGWYGGATRPNYQDIPTDGKIQIDIIWDGKHAMGRALNAIQEATLSIQPPAFSAVSTPVSGLVINNFRTAAGDGVLGGGIEWTRLGSTRRGAAIVSRQSTANGERAVGLDFYIGNTPSTTNETLTLAMRLTYDRRIVLDATLPKYADNAAAVAGGLPVGTLYWTATGEVRIVV